MSFLDRDDRGQGHDHRSPSSLYEDDNANQHEEYQSTRSELPAEIPDSQPDPYLPSEIPDSQPDRVCHQYLSLDDLDYSEVSSQLPTREHGDLRLGDASAFEPADYDFGGEENVGFGNCSPDDKENIDPRVNRFDPFSPEQVDDSIFNQNLSRSSAGDTEIIPGGTRLTERFKDRVVSPYHPHCQTPASDLPRVSPAIMNAMSRTGPCCHLCASESVSSADLKFP